jgi:hypothetical protein
VGREKKCRSRARRKAWIARCLSISFAPAPTFEVFARQQSGLEQQRTDRAPGTAIDIGQAGEELAQQVAKAAIAFDETLLATRLAVRPANWAPQLVQAGPAASMGSTPMF